MNRSCHLERCCWINVVWCTTTMCFSSSSFNWFNLFFWDFVKSNFASMAVFKVLISNSRGKTIFLPYNNSYGDNPVVLCHVVRYAHNAFRTMSAQTLRWLPTIFVRIASITLLVLSTWTLACGWYGEVILCWMWYFCNKASNLWDTNCGPPSVTVSLGSPKRVNIYPYNKSITAWSLALTKATASTHLVI